MVHVDITVNTEQLDIAIRKATKLVEALQEANQLIETLSHSNERE